MSNILRCIDTDKENQPVGRTANRAHKPHPHLLYGWGPVSSPAQYTCFLVIYKSFLIYRLKIGFCSITFISCLCHPFHKNVLPVFLPLVPHTLILVDRPVTVSRHICSSPSCYTVVHGLVPVDGIKDGGTVVGYRHSYYNYLGVINYKH
jgi:hypothetical protein